MATRPRTPARTQEIEDEIEVVGAEAPFLSDLYHLLLRSPWWLDFLVLSALFVVTNLLFAIAYRLTGGVANARSLADCFWFSVETLGTIGYGEMHPTSFAAHSLVTAEAFVGILLVALVTGLTFAKFSVPRALMRFATHATVAPMDGQPTLMFRIGNERASSIVEATIRVTLLKTTRTAEGMLIYRMLDLPLERDRSPALSRSWLIMHRIGPTSPLWGATPESLAREEVEIILTVTGIDDLSAQQMHARYRYTHRDIHFGARHADMLTELDDGRLRLDMRRFHELVPTAPTDEFPYGAA